MCVHQCGQGTAHAASVVRPMGRTICLLLMAAREQREVRVRSAESCADVCAGSDENGTGMWKIRAQR